ncbi:MAG: hypothetical protein JRN20_19280 [Nitrososphaerota archaeon]|jgi:hypothetical protein|nr:hypothetical protein [Nitrososphaerota archaeon]
MSAHESTGEVHKADLKVAISKIKACTSANPVIVAPQVTCLRIFPSPFGKAGSADSALPVARDNICGPVPCLAGSTCRLFSLKDGCQGWAGGRNDPVKWSSANFDHGDPNCGKVIMFPGSPDG